MRPLHTSVNNTREIHYCRVSEPPLTNPRRWR